MVELKEFFDGFSDEASFPFGICRKMCLEMATCGRYESIVKGNLYICIKTKLMD